MRKSISLIMAAALIFAVSCKKDKQEVLTATDAKSALNSGTSSLGADLEDIANTEGMKAMDNVESASAPFGNPMKSAMVMMKSKTLKSMTNIQADDFDFDAAKGEWEYVAATDEVVKKANSTVTDKMILYFPSDSNNLSVNDAKLTVYEYASLMLIDDSYYYPDTTYQPTKLTADIYIGTSKVVDVALVATYTSEGAPTAINATVSVVPYSLSMSYSESGATQKMDASLKNSSKTILAAGVTLTFPSATAKDTTPDYFEGYVQIEDIKMSGKANLKTMMGITEPKAADFNANCSLSFTRVSDNAKIGDLKAYDETDAYGYATIVPYIVFSDGTKEDPEVYLTQIQEDIDALIPQQQPL